LGSARRLSLGRHHAMSCMSGREYGEGAECGVRLVFSEKEGARARARRSTPSAPDAGWAMAVGTLFFALAATALQRGKLCFGAARGPPSHIPERDGPWRAGYWIELEDGKTVCVPTDAIDAGLREGDQCGLDYDGGTARVRTVAAMPALGRAPRPPHSFSLSPEVLQAAATVIAIVGVASILAANRPEPSIEERIERCERLISGSVAARDRDAASMWTLRCELERDAAERILEQAWRRRWDASIDE